MLKLPLQTARSLTRSTSVSFQHYSRSSSSSASDRTMCVDRAVNELQAAQGTTATGRIVNKICTRLANERATTRTEQLIWLAKHALDTSVKPKPETDGGVDSVSYERSEKDEDKGKEMSAAAEVNSKHRTEGVSMWPYLW